MPSRRPAPSAPIRRRAGRLPAARPLLHAAALLLAALPARAAAPGIPMGFIHLTDLARTVRLDIRYHGSRNVVGRPLQGYHAPTCILSLPAARRLLAVQRELRPMGLTLKVFDCYRPQQAVDDLVAWTHGEEDPDTRAQYHPHVPRHDLVARGYIAGRSGHSRGSTVDLTLAYLPAPEDADATPPVQGPRLADGEVDMGTPFDFFDVKSHTDHPDLPAYARHNRHFLRDLMKRHGFRNLPEEWWHYTLNGEPHPDTYFNFPVR